MLKFKEIIESQDKQKYIKTWAKDAYGCIEDAKMKIEKIRKNTDDKVMLKVLDEADDNIMSLLAILGALDE